MRRVLLRVGDAGIDSIIEDEAAERCVRAAHLVADNKGIGIADADLVHAIRVLSADAATRSGGAQDLPALIVDGRPRIPTYSQGAPRA